MSDRRLIEVEQRGVTTTISLNRPEKRNALTPDMILALKDACLGVSDNERCRVVVITATGTDFSLGVDLALPPNDEKTPTLLSRRRAAGLGGQLLRAVREIPQPTICAVRGVAMGGGACIASACDFRIAADNARVGYGEVKMGMNLMWGGVPQCMALIGLSRAKQMIMSGDLLDAETLLDWGFFDAVCTEEEMNREVARWIDRYAQLPPIAVQMIKSGINNVADAVGAAVMHMDSDQFLLAVGSKDSEEAIAAFLSKREPIFSGN